MGFEPGNYTVTFNENYLLTKFWYFDIVVGYFFLLLLLGLVIFIAIKFRNFLHKAVQECNEERNNFLKQEHEKKIRENIQILLHCFEYFYTEKELLESHPHVLGSFEKDIFKALDVLEFYDDEVIRYILHSSYSIGFANRQFYLDQYIFYKNKFKKTRIPKNN